MHKYLFVIGIITVFLMGCTNARSKMKTIWNVVTDKPETEQSTVIKQPQKPVKVEEQIFTDEQMVYRNRLSKKIKKQLVRARRMSEEAGGSVHVICPASATQRILDDIESTGVTYEQLKAKPTGYIVIFTR